MFFEICINFSIFLHLHLMKKRKIFNIIDFFISSLSHLILSCIVHLYDGSSIVWDITSELG